MGAGRGTATGCAGEPPKLGRRKKCRAGAETINAQLFTISFYK
jgi:hypothetical protein